VVANEDAALHPRLLSLVLSPTVKMNTLVSLSFFLGRQKKKKNYLGFPFFFFDFFFVLCFCYFSGTTTKSVLYFKEINANTHHLWNDDDDENDEYFTPFETKKTKRDYYSHCDYFDDDEQ
jgi:hypothetical protein